MSPLRPKVSPRAALGALLGPSWASLPPPGGPQGPLGSPWEPFSRDVLWVNAIWGLLFSFLRNFKNSTDAYARVHFLTKDTPREAFANDRRPLFRVLFSNLLLRV